jgi:hypothetical protein
MTAVASKGTDLERDRNGMLAAARPLGWDLTDYHYSNIRAKTMLYL